MERRERDRTMFVANPFKFTKATLDGTKRGSLQLKPCKKKRWKDIYGKHIVMIDSGKI